MTHEIKFDSKISKRPNEAELVHMLYDAVIDNSLWPEMISELMEHIRRPEQDNFSNVPEVHRDLVVHFERAMRLSENIVGLQEQNTTLVGVLDSLEIGICVYDHSGTQIYANRSATNSKLADKSLLDLNARAAASPESSKPALPELSNLPGVNVALINASSINDATLPPNAATLAISLPAISRQSLEEIQRTYYLTPSETDLLWALHKLRNLRNAAEHCDLTYESARTYLKRVFLKTGCSDQSSLLLMVERNPLSLITRRKNGYDENSRVRKNFKLNDGRNLEYFDLGPRQGELVLHFDALTGVAIDLLGNPETYRPHLDALSLRIVVPCRPGTFTSSYRRLRGLSEFTSDVCQLLDHLNVSSTTVLSQAFGSCSALAFAATAPERVDKLILCAPSYPRHEPPDWRKMDLFYIISGVIGRRAPSLLKAIVPYLMRSVMQNTNKYLERHIANSKCAADIAVLSSPTIQQRIPEMLALRTVKGLDGLVQENFLNTHGWDFNLESIVAPVHILQGELDNVSDPDGSRKLVAALPNGHYHSMNELGQYLLFMEWPWILEACVASDPSQVIRSNIK